MVDLASATDVEGTLGRDLTEGERSKVGAILAKASEQFRLESRQEFTEGRSSVRLQSVGGRIYLPERPATAVHSVTDDLDVPVEFSHRGSWLVTQLRSSEYATVDYSHGSETVPALVRLTVAEVAARILRIPDDAAIGVTQKSETTGPFTDSVTYAGWAQGAQVILSPDDRAIARSFRPRTPRVTVMRP